jgi:subtilisin-like proprotein convertase family protein
MNRFSAALGGLRAIAHHTGGGRRGRANRSMNRLLHGRDLRVEQLEQRTLLTTNWTVLVYLDGDNNLDEAGVLNVNHMESVNYPVNGSVKVAVQFDRAYDSAWSETRRALIVHDTNTDTMTSFTGSYYTSIGEADMGLPATLTSFIQWGVSNFPANHYLLDIWDHGGGLDGICWDDTSGNNLTVGQVRQAIANAGTHMDVIGFDACLMGMEETGHEIRSLGDVMVASEETIPWDGWPYNTWVADLAANPSMTASQLGTDIVQKYGAYYNPLESDTTLSAVSLANEPALAASLSTFAQAATACAEWSTITAARNASHNYEECDYLDLGTFLQYVGSHAVNSTLRSTANSAYTSYQSAVIQNYSGSEEGGTGLSIYLPAQGTSLRSDYTAANLLFVNDTQWKTFLTAYVAGAGSGNDTFANRINLGSVSSATVGGSNVGYTGETGEPAQSGAVNSAWWSWTAPSAGTLTVNTNGSSFDTYLILATGSSVGALTKLTEDDDAGDGSCSLITWPVASGTQYQIAVDGYLTNTGAITLNLAFASSVPAPDVNLQGNGQNILDGDTTPSTGDNTDFGSANVASGTVVRTFTIQNTGAAALNLTGSPRVQITGTNCGDFAVTAQPSGSTIAAGSSLTFQVTFDPSAVGVRTATVNIASNDPDESAYDFAIQGEGTTGGTTFSNTGPIAIPSSGSASPYPSTISVAGLSGIVTDVNVTLKGFTHTWPSDVDVLLVGPAGQNLIVLSDVGYSYSVTALNLTLDDAAAGSLPASSALTSGTYKPTNSGTGDTFPAPAPTPSSATTLATFNGANPNGTWSLYVYDDSGSDLGSVSGGWSLWIATRLYGDADLDGAVNGADLNILLSNYNKSFDITGNPYAAWSFGDFNQDGFVNGADLNIVLSNYNQSVPVASAADVTPPTATVNQARGQADATSASPIHFTVVFSEPVSDFTAEDVTLGGTAPGKRVTNLSGSGTTYDVEVGGMTGSGTVVASIAVGKAHDAAGNPNAASTSTDNRVQYTMLPPRFALTAPVGGVYLAGQRVTVQWTAGNVRPGSKISLCYDKDRVWNNGNEYWIEVDQIAAADGRGSYAWNTGNVPAGTYYVAGYMSDGAGTFAYSHRMEPITIWARMLTRTAAAPLLVGAWLPPQGAPALLSNARLAPIVAEAARRWQRELGTRATVGLAGVKVEVADLPGGMLGEATGKTIRIDRDAAGYGWFVDPTPGDDREFAALAASHTLTAQNGTAAAQRADLLTAVMHEMGHVLGYGDDLVGDLMNSVLPLGARRTAVSR